MTKRNILASALFVILVVVLAVSTAFAATIDPTARTVTTGAFFVDWNDTNPEEIVDIRWKGSPNLTKTAVIGGCPDDLEYFGNSWVSIGPGPFRSLVGWGTTGEWKNAGHKKIKISSSSEGCPGSVGIPVKTDYRFFDRGPRVNTIRVHRRFSFGSAAFPHNFQPYIPRLFPRNIFTQVLHPNSNGTTLLTELSANCEFGCVVTDWNGSWFAIHDPSGQRGMIVRHKPSRHSVALWVDQDGASFANPSSVMLLQPSGGFTGKVDEVQFLCFYDSSIWTPSTTLPPGC